MMRWIFGERTVLTVLGVGALLLGSSPVWGGGPETQERHFTVKNRPVVVLQNIVNGRIEVKSWKNSEVVVTSSFAPGKVEVDIEQVGDRIDINASALTTSTQPHDAEANFTLTVPEQTELQLKT